MGEKSQSGARGFILTLTQTPRFAPAALTDWDKVNRPDSAVEALKFPVDNFLRKLRTIAPISLEIQKLTFSFSRLPWFLSIPAIR
jgi:hypothetical protein